MTQILIKVSITFDINILIYLYIILYHPLSIILISLLDHMIPSFSSFAIVEGLPGFPQGGTPNVAQRFLVYHAHEYYGYLRKP